LDQLDCIPAIGEDRAPVWPAHISGSITHSTGRAAAIVGHKAQWRGLGMDLENLLSLERAERLAGEILTADELQRMVALPREHIALLVTLTFSAKESLFKALYPIVQKRFYFEHAEVVEWTEAGDIRLRLLTDLSAEWCHGTELIGQFAVDGEQLLSLLAVGA
ncbi:4'-phosphopantetheinyl transferase family protein, partial [Pseudomonas sp.]|uniref:4'-phosphopantetheinyl transferase family protein n=1 Tax=Pseudomonas sp. TaxID=306 RepID=UPI003C3AEFC1